MKVKKPRKIEMMVLRSVGAHLHCRKLIPAWESTTRLGRQCNVSPAEDDPADATVTFLDAKRVMRLVNIESLKEKLLLQGKETIPYTHLIAACKSSGLARSDRDAQSMARVLDDAGVVFLFRDQVYLHPQKMADLVLRSLPNVLTPDNNPSKVELKKMVEKKQKIDALAHKQVRLILWVGLGLTVTQVALFFRLTFWELSWDVMEPIAFFVTAGGLVISYAFFMFTSKEPTYQDFMKRLFLSRQMKHFKRLEFDVEHFRKLQQKCGVNADFTSPVSSDYKKMTKF